MADLSRPVIAHATKLRRITLLALRRAMQLTGFCEMCGTTTQTVAFLPDGQFAETCAGCAGEANRREGDDR